MVKVKEDLKLLSKKFDQVKISWNYMNYTYMSTYPEAKFPEKFKMRDSKKFEGSGPPIIHLQSYHRAMTLLGASEEIMAQMYQQALKENSLIWFLSLEESRICSWEDVAREFMSQYKYNEELEVTRRDLRFLSRTLGKQSIAS